MRRLLPRHVGVIMDGNRRWARAQRLLDVSSGHRVGAEHLSQLLDWLPLAETPDRHLGIRYLRAMRLRTGVPSIEP